MLSLPGFNGDRDPSLYPPRQFFLCFGVGSWECSVGAAVCRVPAGLLYFEFQGSSNWLITLLLRQL